MKALMPWWDGGQYGMEVQEGEDMCIHRADSLHWTAETSTMNIIKWLCVRVCAHLCLTLHSPVDCSHPGSSVHGASQARILEWVAISYFRESSQHGDQTHISSLLHWQLDSLPLCHIGSTKAITFQVGKKKDLTYIWFSNGPHPFTWPGPDS